jgi:hypothetical protein
MLKAVAALICWVEMEILVSHGFLGDVQRRRVGQRLIYTCGNLTFTISAVAEDEGQPNTWVLTEGMFNNLVSARTEMEKTNENV